MSTSRNKDRGTDLDRLAGLLEEWGVRFNAEITTQRVILTVTVPSEKRTNVRGYSDFFTEFEFDGAGKFDGMGVWE